LVITGHTELTTHPNVITEPAGSYDAVILTCKAYQTASLGSVVAPLVAEGGILATLQNGLGNGEKLARFIDPTRVAVALTSHGITVEAPGRLRHAGEGATKVGSVPGHKGPAAGVLEGLLADAGLAPQATENMRGAIWQKAIVNAGINPVAAMQGVTNGALLNGPLAELSASLVREAVALAGRARVALPPGDLVELTRAVCTATAENKVSMLQDVEAKRPTEIEQITGRMVRLAETLLVSMPRNESVYGKIKDLESSYLGAEASQQTAWDETHFLSDLV
jgi:2-dehydropantoate 2-reductase